MPNYYGGFGLPKYVKQRVAPTIMAPAPSYDMSNYYLYQGMSMGNAPATYDQYQQQQQQVYVPNTIATTDVNTAVTVTASATNEST
jgi:hypothetical protein